MNHHTQLADEGALPVSSFDAALEDVFARFQAELLGTVCCVTGNAEDARDVLQEAFVKCWRNRDKVPEIANLKSWVFCIAINAARDFRGSAWRRRNRPLPQEGDMLEAKQRPAEETLDRNEQLERVRQAVGELRTEEQAVFLLRQNGELTYDQIAAELDLPLGTVKTRMRLALTKLREALNGAN